AGVLVALTIPARPRYQPPRFSRAVRSALDEFDAVHRPGEGVLHNQRQFSLLQALETGIHGVQTPLQRLEHAFQIPVGVLVMPIFALVNAGIGISAGQLGALLAHPITLGTGLGLVLGKFVGIAGTALLAVRLRLAPMPTGVGTRQMLAAGLLGGIGFTMSIFIADLAFAGMARELLMAKTGILFASALAGVGASLLLAWPGRDKD
ncbi:MAG TPA: Na+/H+ antiporter NhaA, partial [Gammaproteobacteria bacterium]|nr:Na+/H+ antiporter NhaA [Gammaproteobacteria bacterium]